MSFNRLYYSMKPLIPRKVQVRARSLVARRKMRRCAGRWPIDPRSGEKPPGWSGWPDGKKFALVLTHDVDTLKGHDRCRLLSQLEEAAGFVSSFNFVAKRYRVSETLRRDLVERDFEVGVHGVYHDGKLFQSHDTFQSRRSEINEYLRRWNAVGFRSPAMHRNLDWILDLKILYDSSTFDTDPFEPQPNGIGTIFPFVHRGRDGRRGFVELPYTLPQDFTLFVLLNEDGAGIWQKKLDWIAENGGMALLNTHPDYMCFGKTHRTFEEYPFDYYADFLSYARDRYNGRFWHALPREVAAYVRGGRYAGSSPPADAKT